MAFHHSNSTIKGFIHLVSDYKSNPITIAVSAIAAIYPRDSKGTEIRMIDNELSFGVIDDYNQVLSLIEAAVK